MGSRRHPDEQRPAGGPDGIDPPSRLGAGTPSVPSRPDSSPPDQTARDRTIIAAVFDPIITIDGHGTIQSASDSVLRVLGWTPAELIGLNVNILMPEPHHSAHNSYLTTYHQTGETSILNRPRRVEAMRKDGSVVPIELNVSRVDLPGGGLPLFVGIIRDMSAYVAVERTHDEERVRHQRLLAEQTAALQTAHLQLRMADRMASIGTLAAGLGHDMNNVLLPVRAHLNALGAAGEAGEIHASERKHIDAIRKSIAYLQQLADGLHFLALNPETEEDARAAGSSGDGATTDLREWWSQVGPLISKAVPKHVRVFASFPHDLPRVALPSHGLTQATLNLVVNAGEAIPGPSERKRYQGSVRVWAHRAESVRGPCVWLGVSDNGAGMPEEIRRRAFEMFFTTKPRGLGTGLGLALVRKIAERAGGAVEIESEVGKGTKVSMLLPAVHSTEADGRPAHPPTAVISLRDGRASALVRHMLEESGARVRADADPGDAEIWIVDAAAADLREVKAWRAGRPHGRLVVFGAPDAAAAPAWDAMEPTVVVKPDDFEAVRAALGRASASV